MLSTDAYRAFYGYDHVVKAAEQDAIETLLLTDSLFRYLNAVLKVIESKIFFSDLVDLTMSQQGKNI